MEDISYKTLDGIEEFEMEYMERGEEDIFELDKIENVDEVSVFVGPCLTSSSSSSIGSCGAEKSAPGGRAGRKRSAKLSVCSIKTVSEGTPPYISIMGRKNSVVTEMAAPVPDQAWVGKNTRFVKGKKGRVRKNNIYHTQANMFEDYQKRVQERMSDVNDPLEEDFEDNRDSKVSVVTTLT